MNSYTPEIYLSTAQELRALAHENRLRILHWLADPTAHFPPQVDGDLVSDGVCVGFITEKIGLKQPTVTKHMQILQEAGMVESKKIKNWVFYKLRADRIDDVLGKVGQMY
ncbi:ArsR/SmtB family transcription factor [Leisingera methylohalidivorans]|uniref:ArsR family transcriptional regulator n=1 Tax=Leisingera methylohalidivorans DSM 14336 TaxID=999552 RepID=V9VUW4_9RHOB|nr:metalloregulator ArsR/SmtB family transcription factor [Leisingera methylohalidivorans]AHD01120.1 ArsR family transcriptional regulator [Leisingera methylohalidivorans DSM 14336]